MTNRLSRIFQGSAAALLTAVLVTGVAPAHAAYPEQPIHWIVPFPPGGAMDSIARAVGEQLSRSYGQPVIIENKPGAGGNLGMDAVAKAAPDGYTIMITSVGMVTNRYLYPKLPYNPDKDFAPVAQLAVVPNVLVVNPQRIKARNVADLIAQAKAQPGKLSFASAGNGTSIHLAGELFASMTGISMVHIPYRGSGPAVSDLIGGQVDMMFDSVSSARPHLQAGKVLALGVTTRQRSSTLPDLPTIEQGGVTGYDVTPWFGVFAPAGTPRPVLQSLNKALNDALQRTEIKARLSVIGAEPSGGTAEKFAALLEAENAKWAKIIRERNIQAD